MRQKVLVIGTFKGTARDTTENELINEWLFKIEILSK